MEMNILQYDITETITIMLRKSITKKMQTQSLPLWQRKRSEIKTKMESEHKKIEKIKERARGDITRSVRVSGGDRGDEWC